MFNDEEILTAKEVAVRLKMTPKGVHYYRLNGRLPAQKTKVNRYVFKGEDLNILMQRQWDIAKQALQMAFEDSVSNKEECQNENDTLKGKN